MVLGNELPNTQLFGFGNYPDRAQNHSIMKIFKLFMKCSLGLCLLGMAVSVQAQFSPAITPNLTLTPPLGDTNVMGVTNTDAFLHTVAGFEFAGVVWDGGNPSFSVVFGPSGSNLGTSLTVPISGSSIGQVSDPSVIVVPFNADGLALVTYEVNTPSGVTRIFSEAYSLSLISGVTLILPPTLISTPGTLDGSYSPNMDVNANGEYVITWVEGDRILAKGGSLTPALLSLSPSAFDVSLNTPALTVSSLFQFNSTVDVAINNAGRVNFVYSDGFAPVGNAAIYLTSVDYADVLVQPGALSGATIPLTIGAGQGPFIYYAPKIYMDPLSPIASIVASGNDINTFTTTVIGWTVNTFTTPVLVLPAPSVIIGAIPGGGSTTRGQAFNIESPSITGAGPGNCMTVGWSFQDGNSLPTIPGLLLGGAYTVGSRSFFTNGFAPLPVGITTLNLLQTTPASGTFGSEFDRSPAFSGKFSTTSRFVAAWYDATNGQMRYKVVSCGAVSYRKETLAEVEEEPAESFALTAYPNPFSSDITFEFTLEEGDHGQAVEVYDLQGQLVFQQSLREAQSGPQRIEWGAGDGIGQLPGGIYLVKVITDHAVQTLKINKQ